MMDSFTRKPRTLVLCFDGTSNQYDENVSRCASASSCEMIDYSSPSRLIEYERGEIVRAAEEG